MTALQSFGESVTVPVAYGNSYTLTVTGGPAIIQNSTIYVCPENEYNFTVTPHTTGTWTAYASPASGTIAPDGSQTTINVSTITYTPGPDEPASESEFSVEVSVGVVKVEITKYDEKMLVEGEFQLQAKATPEISGKKYNWSFVGTGGGKFKPNPSSDGKTKFTAKTITDPDAEGKIRISYAGADDEKEVKITRLDGIYTKDGSLTQNSGKFERGENTPHTLFAHVYKYFMYDQYRKGITESSRGGVLPMIREKFGKSSSLFPEIADALKKAIKAIESKDWSPQKYNQFDDSVKLANIYEEYFRPTTKGEFYEAIKNNRSVFTVSNHVWLGSINKTNYSGDEPQ